MAREVGEEPGLRRSRPPRRRLVGVLRLLFMAGALSCVVDGQPAAALADCGVRHRAVQQPAEECPITPDGGACWFGDCRLLVFAWRGAVQTPVIATCWQEGYGADMPPGAVRGPLNLAFWIAGTSDQITAFHLPVHLVAFYQDAEVSGANEGALGLACHDTKVDQWELLEGVSVDTGANRLTMWFDELANGRCTIVDTEQFAGRARATPSQALASTPTLTATVTYASSPEASVTPCPTHTATGVASPTATAARTPTQMPSSTPRPTREPTASPTAKPSLGTTPQLAATPTLAEVDTEQRSDGFLVLVAAIAAAVGVVLAIVLWARSRQARSGNL